VVQSDNATEPYLADRPYHVFYLARRRLRQHLGVRPRRFDDDGVADRRVLASALLYPVLTIAWRLYGEPYYTRALRLRQ
jgi:hypothetical protein